MSKWVQVLKSGYKRPQITVMTKMFTILTLNETDMGFGKANVRKSSLQALKLVGMFSAKSCCPNYERFARKISLISEIGGGLQPSPPPWPVRLCWGNKTKEINFSSLNLDVISFVLLPQASSHVRILLFRKWSII